MPKTRILLAQARPDSSRVNKKKLNINSNGGMNNDKIDNRIVILSNNIV